jgi:hypothetical protein
MSTKPDTRRAPTPQRQTVKADPCVFRPALQPQPAGLTREELRKIVLELIG